MISSKVSSGVRFVSQLRASCSRPLSISTSLKMPIKVGDSLPSVKVYKSPDVEVDVRQLFEGKKGILFALPGAYTPTCSNTHFPDYVKEYDNMKAKGISVIACLSVNDPFVMEAWCKEQNGTDKIVMLSDVMGEFSKAVDLTLDVKKLGGIRSKRYSMVIEDGVVKELNIETDSGGASCSLASKLRFKF